MIAAPPLIVLGPLPGTKRQFWHQQNGNQMFRRLFLTRNVAWWDRLLRLLPAAISAWAYFHGYMAGPLAIALSVVSVMLLVTSLTGTCSIYGLFGLSTYRKPPKPSP